MKLAKRKFTGRALGFLAAALGVAAASSAAEVLSPTSTNAPPTTEVAFVHPGLLHSRDELALIKAKVAAGEQPWRTAWSEFIWSPYASVQWTAQPEPHVVRDNRRPWRGARELGDDALAAYANAIHYAISGDERHARKAAEILNAWSAELETITGHDDKLLAGIVGYKLCNAAEILRHTWTGWPAADQSRFRQMLNSVFMPVIKDFFPEANGNWDASMIVTTMSIGVFCDDRATYDRAVEYFLHGSGNGALTNYVFASGQCQETTRDQQHTQLGLAYLADACETAWKQGDDLWGVYDNRLAVGFEYTARYNLGEGVTVEGRISRRGRGRFRPIYEKVYRHYHDRVGLEMAATRDVLAKIRPEGSHWDHASWGTLLFAAAPLPPAPQAPATVDDPTSATSPNGEVTITFKLLEGGAPSYRIDYLGKPLVMESRLGFQPGSLEGFQVIASRASSHEGEWTNDFGERREVPDRYHELTVNLKHDNGQLLRLQFRAYDEGAAFRYVAPREQSPDLEFHGEESEFRFPAGVEGYEEHGTEGEYRLAPVADMKPWGERPLTLVFPGGRYACLTEAANYAYPRMLLSPLGDGSNSLVSALGGRTSNTESPSQRHDSRITLKSGEASPWRAFIVGQRPGDLLERNYLLLNLNDAAKIADVSWIKPGKVMRETTLTTANAKAIIDFADAVGLGYVHFDQGWYGTEDFETGDATRVRRTDLDLREVLRYGREHGVGVIVYVDRRQIKKQRDTLFSLFEKWGVKGVKLGFVDVGPQSETAWITETIAKAAEHHLMLNIHDGYRGTAINRTYPNLMTVEGIRGNEHMPTPEHNCTLPFTRYVGGVGDYTVCYYDGRLKTTHAHQLAMTVVSFSPLQWIFWYDKPNMYRGEPEIEFFRRVPTVWDETRVLHGVIGQYAAIARRSGDEWFIGVINDSTQRTLDLPLDFLPPGKSFTAKIYADDEAVDTRTHVRIDRQGVNAATVLAVPLVAGGGQSIWISPQDN